MTRATLSLLLALTLTAAPLAAKPPLGQVAEIDDALLPGGGAAVVVVAEVRAAGLLSLSLFW